MHKFVFFWTLVSLGALSCNDRLNLPYSGSCKTVIVDFYTDHPDYEFIPPVFDTLTEQVLQKTAYNMSLDGEDPATFETNTEQILSRQGHSRMQMDLLGEVAVLTNKLEFTTTSLDCYDLISVPQIDTIASLYTTRSFQLVVSNPGTGSEVPATYTTFTYFKLASDGHFITRVPNSVRTFRRDTFNIQSYLSIDEYLKMQFAEAGLSNCSAIQNYRIVE